MRWALYICVWVVLGLDGDLRDFYSETSQRKVRNSVCLSPSDLTKSRTFTVCFKVDV